jgi:hypothetical protein
MADAAAHGAAGATVHGAADAAATEAPAVDEGLPAHDAAALRALVQALQGADARAQHAAAQRVTKLAAGKVDALAHPAVCLALVECGVVAALLHAAQAPGARVPTNALFALAQLCSVCVAARLAVLAAGGIAAMLRVLRSIGHDTRNARELFKECAADVILTCLRTMAIREACAADADFSTQMRLTFCDLRIEAPVGLLVSVLRAVVNFGTHNAAGRTAMWTADCVTALAALLAQDVQCFKVSFLLCDCLRLVQMKPSESRHLELFDAGIYASVMQLLGTMHEHFCAATEVDGYGPMLPARTLGVAFVGCEQLQPHIRRLLLQQRGALAGFAFGAYPSGPGFIRRTIMHVLHLVLADLQGLAGWWLLDESYGAAAVLRLRRLTLIEEDAAVVRAFVADASSASSLRALAHPPAAQRLPAAVSLAMLACDAACFRHMLAAESRLDTLVHALLRVADDAGGAKLIADMPHALQWEYTVLCEAMASVITAAGLATAPTSAAAAEPSDDAPGAKRQRISAGATLRASDVNVQRRDSTVLLIGGAPFYVNGGLLESKSAVLADALRNVETLEPIALPLPSGCAAEQHYALFRSAVEHTYTGSVAELDAASLLPLWCLGDHLRMDELREWCIVRMAPLLPRDAAMLEAVWLAALARPCDALCGACATAWLRMLLQASAAKEEEGVVDATRLLARVHAHCRAAHVSLSAQLVRVLRSALQPPTPPAAAAAAAAAAADA